MVNEKADSAVAFTRGALAWSKRFGVRVERIMTGRGHYWMHTSCVSSLLRAACEYDSLAGVIRGREIDVERPWPFRRYKAAKRGAFLLQSLLAVGQGGISVRRLGGDRAGELRLTRFLRNPHVTAEEMLATARAHLLGRVAGRHVLVIQDTTSLRDNGRSKSLQLHPAIGVDAEAGTLLGVLGASFLRRDQPVGSHCNKRALADKESRRWVDTTREAAAVAEAGARTVTVVADREGDMYEEFALRPANVEVLIRVHHDRTLDDGSRLHTATAGAVELGRETIELPAVPGRPARSATLALRAQPVAIKRPKRNRAAWAAELPPTVALWLLEAQEVDPPPEAAAAHWRLLTTHRVETRADALRLIGLYRQRWHIEQVFRVMKTQGFDIEDVRIGAAKPFETLAAATLIAAVQVQQMCHDRDGTANRPMTDVFDSADQPVLEAICTRLEGKTTRQKNPHPSGSLAYATWVCARLGGWTGYYRKPGPIVILRGHLKLQAMREGWSIAQDVRIQ